jgi:hypothetical protein
MGPGPHPQVPEVIADLIAEKESGEQCERSGCLLAWRAAFGEVTDLPRQSAQRPGATSSPHDRSAGTSLRRLVGLDQKRVTPMGIQFADGPSLLATLTALPGRPRPRKRRGR